MSITRYEHEDMVKRQAEAQASVPSYYANADREAIKDEADAYCSHCGGTSISMDASVFWRPGTGWVIDHEREDTFYCSESLPRREGHNYDRYCEDKGSLMFLKLDGDSRVVRWDDDPEDLTAVQQERLAVLRLVEDDTRVPGVGHRVTEYFYIIE